MLANHSTGMEEEGGSAKGSQVEVSLPFNSIAIPCACTNHDRRFPKIPNDVIKDTLGSHFAQVGPKRDDKKWVFVGTA